MVPVETVFYMLLFVITLIVNASFAVAVAQWREIYDSSYRMYFIKGDMVCMAWTQGPIASTSAAIWAAERAEMGLGGRFGGVVL